MLFIYNILINLFTFVVFLAKRSKINSEQIWQGRFARNESIQSCDIWLHAASVGEVKVIGYLIGYLQKHKPVLKIHVTTMTKAGFATAELLFKDKNISQSFYPFDTKKIIYKTFEKLQPKMLVIAETEIWPNTILEASKRKIPIILINGRMSKKGFKKYRLLKNTFSKLLAHYEKLFLKSEDDLKRFSYFNLQKSQVNLCGDMKFDAPVIERSEEKVRSLKKSCGIQQDSFLMVAGSTRPGEEELLIKVFQKIYSNHKTFNMVIAPRHLERIGEIKEILYKFKIPFKLFGSESQLESLILVDRFGVLQKLYSGADVSFVGGTMVNLGGHNLLEPVWSGSPVIFGESIYNVHEAASYIQENNYGAKVSTEKELYELIVNTFNKEHIFNRKRSSDLENSPTGIIGKYILEKFDNV